MQISLDALPQSPCAMPDLTILNPKRKDKKYILQFGRGFLTAYRNSGSRDFYNGRTHYALLDEYANGENKVKSALKRSDAARDERSTSHIDFRPLPLLHKPLMSVEGLLKDHSYEVSITPVDPVSQDERADYEARMRAWMDHQQFLQSLGLQQPGGQGADIPVDEDDLSMHMDVSYKIREAIEMEQKVAYGMYLADFARQDQQCTRDEAVKGVSVMVMQRRGRCLRLPKRLDPGQCFILPATSEDFPNLQAGAHLERASLGSVLAEIEADPDTTLDATQRRALEQLAAASQTGRSGSGNGSYYLDGALGDKPEIAGELTLLRFAFVSTDYEVQKEYTNKFGNKAIRKMEADYGGPQEANPGQAKDMKIHRRTVQNWYEGTLILGSDIGFGCRLAYGQMRDEENPFACLPMYIVNAPGLMGGKITSMVDRCRIAVDMASRAVVKMQHAEAKWPDLTVKFNMTALMESAEAAGTGGKVLSRSEVLREWIAEGIVVGNDFDESGNNLGKVVELIETPLVNTMTKHWNTIQNAKNEIADITGINGAISGDDPLSRQGEGVTNLAIQGSQNALNHLFVAKHSRFERVAKAIAASVKAGEDKGTAPVVGTLNTVGKNGRKAQVYVKPNPEIAKRSYAFKIEQKPTQEQWAAFYSYMNNFTVGPDPVLAPKDVADLWIVDNLKMARYLLAARHKRAMAERAKRKEAETSMLSQQQQESAKVTGEEERKTLEAAHQFAMELETLKGQNAANVATIQATGHMRSAGTNQQAGLQKHAMTLDHQAAMADADDEKEFAMHDAELTSGENMAAQQQTHERQMLAPQPAPTTA